jgi:hypothetical protein
MRRRFVRYEPVEPIRYDPDASFLSNCYKTCYNLYYDADEHGNYATGTRGMAVVLLCTLVVCLLVPVVNMATPVCTNHSTSLYCTAVIVPLSWDPLLSQQRVSAAVDIVANLAHTLELPSDFATLKLIGPDPRNYTRWLPPHLSTKVQFISTISDEYMMPVSAATAWDDTDGWLLFPSHEYERGCMIDCLREHAPQFNSTVYFLYDDMVLNTSIAEVLRDWRAEKVGCPCDPRIHHEL